jgi:predicted site-specific integrase-resolvase
MNKEIQLEEKEILKDKISTAVSKVKFISEIKSGLGNEIKKNPKQIKIIQKTKGQRLLDWFKKIFTRF